LAEATSGTGKGMYRRRNRVTEIIYNFCSSGKMLLGRMWKSWSFFSWEVSCENQFCLKYRVEILSLWFSQKVQLNKGPFSF